MITVTSTTDSQPDAQRAADASPATSADLAKDAPPSSGTESAEASGTSETEDQEQEAETGKDKGDKGAGYRIKQLHYKAQEAERLRKEADERALKLEAELKAYKDIKETRGDGKPAKDPKTPPNPDEFKSWEDYDQARIGWMVEKRVEELAQHQAKQAQERASADHQQKVIQAWNRQVQDARKRYEDFDEVTGGATAVPVSDAMTIALMESERGADLLYHLATHADEAERIAKLTPYAAAKAMSKLEESLTPNVVEQAPGNRNLASAPNPIRPVGGGGRGHSTKRPDDMSFMEYKRWREAGGGR